MAATFRPYPFNPLDYPDEAKLLIESGTPVVDVDNLGQIDRIVRSGYTAHTEGDRGHAFCWQERGKFRVVNLQIDDDAPARRINFLAIEDAAEHIISCVK